mmetsp:Transcript_33237/g.75207  ORF Transcript_33237/g.75207 Transcript_33237/m.75207 type:complete len:158 (+) Transcript_33237:136-609(+)
MPKLPVHMRTHREAFKRNQRVRDSVARAEKGQSALDKLNEVIKSAKPSTPAVAMPASMPTLNSEAADQSSNKVVAGVVTGDLPESEATERKRVRGGVIEGLESVARESTRNVNYANKGLEKVVEGLDQPSATCLTKTENEGVDDALEHTPKMKPSKN